MLMPFDPFRDLDRVAQMFSQQVSSLRQSVMPMDAYRDGDQPVVRFNLPGVDPESIDLTVEKNVLTVRAERHGNPREAGGAGLGTSAGDVQPAAVPRGEP